MRQSPKDEIKICKIVQKEETVFELFFERNQDGQSSRETMHVDAPTLARLGLLKPGVITAAQYELLLTQNVFQMAYNKAAHYLGYRKRSVAQVERFLTEKGLFSPETIGAVIAKLLEQKYLDDNDFVCAYIATMLQTTLTGPRKIKQKLIECGCAETLVQAQLSMLFTPEQEVKQLCRLREKMLKKRYVSAQAFSEKYNKKALDLGYNYDAIAQQKLPRDEAAGLVLDRKKIVKIIGQTHRRLLKKGHPDYRVKRALVEKLATKGVQFDEAQRYVVDFYEQLGESDET
jgi:regulatory protein